MSTEIARPDGNQTSVWSTNSYLFIDEVVTQPSTPTGGASEEIQADENDDSENQEYTVTTVAAGTISAIKLWAYGDENGGPHVNNASVYTGSWETAKNLTFSGSDGWNSVEWTGLSVDMDNLTAFRFESPATIGKSEEWNIWCAYLEITYTPPVTSTYLRPPRKRAGRRHALRR